MNSFLDKYHLRIGLFVAAAFPGVFVFSERTQQPMELLIIFLSTFLFIFISWTIDFVLVDFKRKTGKEGVQPERKWPYMRIVASFLLVATTYVTIGLVFDNNFLSPVEGGNITSLKSWFFFCLRLSLFNGFILLVKYLFDTTEEKQQISLENELLKRENLNARHETLKQQKTPHFLFNSLNTLRSLIKTQNTEQAVKFTSELARIYRYMLRHSEKTEVAVGEEINFVKSYLYLLEIRFGNALFTDINIPEDYLTNKMPSNTLQLLVENAVKHNSLSQKKPLHISIFIDNNFLIVKNNLQPKNEQKSSSNVGLSNISTRYKMLKNEDIIIQQKEGVFKVLLPLK